MRVTSIKILIILCLFFSLKSKDETVYTDTSNQVLRFVFISDVHYGITRKNFRGNENVDAGIVNKAMIAQINSLPALQFPGDNGVDAGKPIGHIDYIMGTGDIANRADPPYQSATASWKQFTEDYYNRLTTKNANGNPTQLLLVPGNHDVSNAIGYYREMQPATDPTSMVGIYNDMLHPSIRKTNTTYNYATDKVNYSKDISGVHFVFITIWPDSATRIWLSKDLLSVSSTTPVILFAHDPPEAEVRHFTNPNGSHDINATDKFENLLAEQFKDLNTTHPQTTTLEQDGFVSFLKSHPNIKAYFHGHTNYTEFYTYKGPGNDIALPTFRSDSPMKGRNSAVDETKLAFQIVTIDPKTKQLTARECLWNTDPNNPTKPIVWGSSMSISLQ